ncbi:MAG: hypothetical protein AAFP90_07520 [Planctomycetota bacterium]
MDQPVPTPAPVSPSRNGKQALLDAIRALLRAGYRIDAARIRDLRCTYEVPESESSFGSQLWYFETDDHDDRTGGVPLYGVIEYSLQYGLMELVEDGVFEQQTQRERFRSIAQRQPQPPFWSHPAFFYLCTVVFSLGMATLAIWLARAALLRWLPI